MNDELESGVFEMSSNPIGLPSLATEGTRHQSRAGYWFNEDDPVWTLDKDNAVHVERFRLTLSSDAVKGFISTLANYARTMSGSHTRNIADRCSAMLTETGADSINTTVLINYRAVLDRANEWKLGTIRGFLYKWHDLGYPGVEEDVVDLLKGWTIKGNISEILELPVDCEVEVTDSKGVVQYGWRFYSAKGFEGDIKWIPKIMVPIAREAVRRIRALTDEPRRLAAWIETNRDQPYRHADCPDVADDEPLTVSQACAFLGLSNGTRRACTSSLGVKKLATKNDVHTLNSLWQWSLLRQPKGNPWLNKTKNIKHSNALFCMTRNFIGDQRGTSPLVLWAPRPTIFGSTLSPSESTKNHKTIFDRFGYKGSDGRRLKLTSHQARHLLSTLSNRGGLSQEQLAKWAGRADQKHNRVYNHMSEWEMVAKAEALDATLTLFGPKGEVSQYVPVTTQDVNLMERGAMHISMWGVCSHDFILSPCEKFRDCLNCEEHVCIKGAGKDNVDRLQRIKERLAQVTKDYEAANLALAEGYAGADRWFEYQERAVERLRQLVEILESPQIEEGAQIKLRDGKEFSHLRRVIRLKAVESLERDMPNAALLAEMTEVLGGRLG